nr:hypothetical protein GCM10020092_089770 [Actinoplanes digitatis]
MVSRAPGHLQGEVLDEQLLAPDQHRQVGGEVLRGLPDLLVVGDADRGGLVDDLRMPGRRPRTLHRPLLRRRAGIGGRRGGGRAVDDHPRRPVERLVRAGIDDLDAEADDGRAGQPVERLQRERGPLAQQIAERGATVVFGLRDAVGERLAVTERHHPHGGSRCHQAPPFWRLARCRLTSSSTGPYSA